MTVDFISQVPREQLDLFQACLDSPEANVRRAVLAAAAVGRAEGKQVMYEAIDGQAQYQLAAVASELGGAMTFDWLKPDDPRWLQRKEPQPRPSLPSQAKQSA